MQSVRNYRSRSPFAPHGTVQQCTNLEPRVCSHPLRPSATQIRQTPIPANHNSPGQRHPHLKASQIPFKPSSTSASNHPPQCSPHYTPEQQYIPSPPKPKEGRQYAENQDCSGRDSTLPSAALLPQPHFSPRCSDGRPVWKSGIAALGCRSLHVRLSLGRRGSDGKAAAVVDIGSAGSALRELDLAVRLRRADRRSLILDVRAAGFARNRHQHHHHHKRSQTGHSRLAAAIAAPELSIGVLSPRRSAKASAPDGSAVEDALRCRRDHERLRPKWLGLVLLLVPLARLRGLRFAGGCRANLFRVGLGFAVAVGMSAVVVLCLAGGRSRCSRW